jgi:branched-chain amino acid transport system substrate-binding protein
MPLCPNDDQHLLAKAGVVQEEPIQPADRSISAREVQMGATNRLYRILAELATLVLLVAVTAIGVVRTATAEPIKIGFSMSLTGPLAANGKQVLVAMEIWREEVNARGGLLGRPVDFVYYDDQGNPANVPAIYTKLLDVDKVDLTIGPYATNTIAPAMPVLMQRNMVTIGILGVAVNSDFHYSKYFSMIAAGPRPKLAFSEGFFAVAMAQNPKPRTVAIVGADAEFAKASTDGARENAKSVGLQIVYDRSYPPATTDYLPVVRAVQATNPDIVYVASYPLDTIGIVRAAHEIGVKPKIFGGNMVGFLAASFKMQLGPLLNGLISTADAYIPAPGFNFAGVQDLLKKYQARAASQGVDPLGYNYAPYGYAALQVLGQAVEATKALNQDRIADYIHAHSFETVVGTIAFGPDGEWTKPRVLVSQFQNIRGNDLDQFRNMTKQIVLCPEEYKTGSLIYPFVAAQP